MTSTARSTAAAAAGATASRSPLAGPLLVVLGLAAVVFGLLWAADHRGMVTRRHARHLEERSRLPAALRRLAPAPPRPGAQRATGLLLAVVGCALVATGAHTFLT
ncbi:hypothetical protein [Kitasatospora sp. NPDC008115]|uniref:hypothetical protein n=1 Tax=Kitasatospora sp. NPDC008115 TaxID=3364022 RepID=UPI0036F17AD3